MSTRTARRTPDVDLERRARQAKEIVRLGLALRAEQGLERILTQLVEAINRTIGFHVGAVNLVREDSPYAQVVATAGISQEDHERLASNPPPVDRLTAMMRDEFRIGRSYFVSHIHAYMSEGIEVVTPPGATHNISSDDWHPDDMFLTPLTSPRTGKLIGILSLDQPEDGKIPDRETIEIIELFVDQAALAIETSVLFEEREHERQELKTGVIEIMRAVENVRHGDLTTRMQASSIALGPIIQSLNTGMEALASVLTRVRSMSHVVTDSATEVRAEAIQLAANTHRRAEHILDAADGVRQLERNARQLCASAVAASTAVGAIRTAAQEGGALAQRIDESTTAQQQLTMLLTKHASQVAGAHQDIGEMTDLVADASQQINLLALNAAIEAARAGEQGHGFAIAATEIRQLASSAAQATEQMQARVQRARVESEQLTRIIEQARLQAATQAEGIAQLGDVLAGLDGALVAATQDLSGAGQAANQQAGQASALAGTMTELAQATAHTREHVERMRAAMDHLVALAGTLLETAARFRLSPDDPAHTQTIPGAQSSTPSGAPLRASTPTYPPDPANGGSDTAPLDPLHARHPAQSTPSHPPTRRAPLLTAPRLVPTGSLNAASLPPDQTTNAAQPNRARAVEQGDMPPRHRGGE